MGENAFLRAGTLRLSWHYAAKGEGWITYDPDKIKVHLAGARQYKTLDLKRFSAP